MTKRDREQITGQVEIYVVERGGVLNARLAEHGVREYTIVTPYGPARVGVNPGHLRGYPWLWLQFEEPERARVTGCSLPSGKLNCHMTREMDARACAAAMKQHLAMVGV